MDRVRRTVSASKAGLPRKGLLAYISRPNTDEYLIGEETEIGEGTFLWGYYVLPASLASILGEDSLFFSGGAPVVKLASEILADPGTNDSHILFKSVSVVQETGRLAVYHPSTSAGVLAQAKKVLRIP